MRPTYESAIHPADLVDCNLFTSNAALVDALERAAAYQLWGEIENRTQFPTSGAAAAFVCCKLDLTMAL